MQTAETPRKQSYSFTEIARLCHVSVATVRRWNRYHGLTADDAQRVDRKTLLQFLEFSGQTELLSQI